MGLCGEWVRSGTGDPSWAFVLMGALPPLVHSRPYLCSEMGIESPLRKLSLMPPHYPQPPTGGVSCFSAFKVSQEMEDTGDGAMSLLPEGVRKSRGEDVCLYKSAPRRLRASFPTPRPAPQEVPQLLASS